MSAVLRSVLLAPVIVLSSCAEDPPVTPFPEPSHQLVAGWPRLPPGVSFGRVLSVAVHPDGRVFVSHDAGHPSPNAEPIAEPTIFVLDADSGELLETLGGGLFRYPHGLSFDAEGQLWVTDSDSDRVVRLGDDGTIELVLGDGAACGD
jgi:DNA-binding beta-propeller fold protein YncE